MVLPVNIIAFFSSGSMKRRVSGIMDKLSSTKANLFTPESYVSEGLKRDKTIRDQHNYFFVGSGGTEDLIARFLQKVKIAPPIQLLTHEGDNSLPAAMEIRKYLEQQGTPARIIHDSLERLIDRISVWYQYDTILEQLRNSRIGIIGNPSPWLIASDIDQQAVTKKWGVEFKKYPMSTLSERIEDDLWGEFSPTLEKFLKDATAIECNNEDIQKAAIVAQSLVALAKNHDLDAVTIECFRLLEDTDITGCFAVSHINTLDNIVAGCEADLPATFTMLLGKYLTGQASFMANIVDVNIDNNSVVFSHCTVPTSIVESYEITSHFESDKSVAIRGHFPFRDITVFKMFGKDLTDYWVSEGVITKNLSDEHRCRTQIRATLTESVSYFLANSLANHHVIIPGKHKQRILDFFDFLQRK
jgi:L-fucose isomerase-like protein